MPDEGTEHPGLPVLEICAGEIALEVPVTANETNAVRYVPVKFGKRQEPAIEWARSASESTAARVPSTGRNIRILARLLPEFCRENIGPSALEKVGLDQITGGVQIQNRPWRDALSKIAAKA